MSRLDRVFSKYIRARDGYRCVVCGSTAYPQCGHILSRVSYATRWDERNAACQCAACNYRHEYTPYPFIKWALANIGIDVLEELQRKWNKPTHLTNPQLREMCEEYDEKLRKLGVGEKYGRREHETDDRYNRKRRLDPDDKGSSRQHGCRTNLEGRHQGSILKRNGDVQDVGDDGEGRTEGDAGSGGTCYGLDLPTLQLGSQPVPQPVS